MDIALQLYGSLILTLLGFVLPILAVLLSVFSDGAKALSEKYESEKKQSEENIISEAKKKESGAEIDYSRLKKTLETLQKRKYRAELRLGYLQPLNVVLKISLPLGISFLSVLIATQLNDLVTVILDLGVSVIAFASGLSAVWTTLSVLAEVSDMVNDSRRNIDNKIVELLSTLVEKSGTENLFLAPNELQANFYNRLLKEKSVFEFSANKKYEIPVSIVNSSERMAKKVELGFIFPEGFLIEKSPNISIFPDGKTQIIRFNQEIIQSHETNLKGKMGVTFLKAGEYDIDTFIKGENVKYQRFNFKIKIIE